MDRNDGGRDDHDDYDDCDDNDRWPWCPWRYDHDDIKMKVKKKLKVKQTNVRADMKVKTTKLKWK